MRPETGPETATDAVARSADITAPAPQTAVDCRDLLNQHKRRGLIIVTATALAVSALSVAYFYHRGMTNLYLDGIAHVNIARKVVDSPEHSFWRHYLQIGSPWLPVHTVLMLPLVSSDFLWRTGLAGTLISMAAFVLAAIAMYLLAWEMYARREKAAHLLPLVTAGVFVFNPAIVYMQATPMTESLFMAVLASAVLMVYRWSRTQSPARLVAAAIVLLVATLTRYEAWPVAALSVLLVPLYSRGTATRKLKNAVMFAAIVAIGPLYWLWHNWAIFGNPFEFLTGPYSARGLFSQNRATLGWSTIFVGHPLLDVILMLIAVAVCVGPLTILLSAAGLARLAALRRSPLPSGGMVALLAVPFLFHVISLYRGEIQVFPISAFGLLNVRYGLPALLPVALLVPAVISARSLSAFRFQAILVLVIIALQYGWLLSSGPSGLDVYQEAYRNGVNSKTARELSRGSAYLTENPAQPMVLMHTGALGPLVSHSGMEFSSVIHEGTVRWHALSHHIPEDISTIIIQDWDLLDMRLHSDPDLERDLAERFREVYRDGRIHIYKRARLEAEQSRINR
jgi:hypothetical protein